MAIRTTVYLDEEVLKVVRQHIPERGLSRFINLSIAEKARDLERKRKEALAIEGYKASAIEQADIDKDWEVVDLEGWPD